MRAKFSFEFLSVFLIAVASIFKSFFEFKTRRRILPLCLSSTFVKIPVQGSGLTKPQLDNLVALNGPVRGPGLTKPARLYNGGLRPSTSAHIIDEEQEGIRIQKKSSQVPNISVKCDVSIGEASPKNVHDCDSEIFSRARPTPPKMKILVEPKEQYESVTLNFAEFAKMVFGEKSIGEKLLVEVLLLRALLCLKGNSTSGLPLGGKEPTALFSYEDFG